MNKIKRGFIFNLIVNSCSKIYFLIYCIRNRKWSWLFKNNQINYIDLDPEPFIGLKIDKNGYWEHYGDLNAQEELLQKRSDEWLEWAKRNL